ncbi:DNA mismatch repair protein-like protein [Legionella moravica]|uniref:DNA mismatch repair protein-like protein n=1 Tax=Legionella moravica TaxID=39962 RepID=A0A378K2V3_9GAMM|nr:Smr/MutS family protein [Legionella moravica]KTD31002.1 DNA mismatch repair protein-like protein [Legionella moravica]STX63579.1 Smr domain protein, DNA mismatch repair protein-like protein [Legionella moravica]
MADDLMSEEDKALFREHMRSVKPLNEKTKRVSNPPSMPAPRLNKKKTATQPENSTYHLSDFISETVQSHSVLSYAHPSITGSRLRSLKNGLIPWEARLDLHGLKTETAREALCRFIQAQAQQNKRCLLIIHGKGGHLGAPPVIKNLINRWLPQFHEVLAFHSALAKDGGHGAVYVLLKKNKQEDYCSKSLHDLR